MLHCWSLEVTGKLGIHLALNVQDFSRSCFLVCVYKRMGRASMRIELTLCYMCRFYGVDLVWCIRDNSMLVDYVRCGTQLF
jgi:hypothetical protein